MDETRRRVDSIKPRFSALTGLVARIATREKDEIMGLVTGRLRHVRNGFGIGALETLERNFSKPVYEMWIKPMRFI